MKNTKHMKKFGDTKTHLELSALAQQVYDTTDPLSIFEEKVEPDDEDGECEYRYSMRGAFGDYDDLPAEEVNERLETQAYPSGFDFVLTALSDPTLSPWTKYYEVHCDPTGDNVWCDLREPGSILDRRPFYDLEVVNVGNYAWEMTAEELLADIAQAIAEYNRANEIAMEDETDDLC